MHNLSNKRVKRGYFSLAQIGAALLLMTGFMNLAIANSLSEQPIMLALLIDDEKRPRKEPLNSQQIEKARSSWAFYIDNDLFALGAADRDYTGGFSFTLSGQLAVSLPISVDPMLGWVDEFLGLRSTRRLTLHSFEVGLNAFTPEDTQSSVALVGDRPYASLIYIANSRQQLQLHDNSSVITTLSVGILGLGLTGKIQNRLHSLWGGEKAQGWGREIAHGGEPTLRYSVAKQKMRWMRYGIGNRSYEVKTAIRGSVGYLTDASFGVSGRWGRIRSPWWTFNPQLADYAQKSVPSVATTGKADEFYVWGGVNFRLRLYNALLQGQFRESVVTYRSDELHPTLVETWLGVTKTFKTGLRLSYLVRAQTAEIKSGLASRPMRWGGFIVSQTF
ncbi:MAG: lipid A deacylase LpxR family protein [Pseudomonadales bacterium]|nr:lipid A deacylase LpxR family protein [Pseudomonadales bacterium]